jgi:hypothetical protein
MTDVRLFMTSVLGESPWEYDSKVIPLPWRYDHEESIKAKLESGGLTVGFYNSDGNVSKLHFASDISDSLQGPPASSSASRS